MIEGSICFNSYEEGIYALRKSDGSLLWRFNSGIRGPLESNLSVKDGVVAILPSKALNGALNEFRMNVGRLLRKYP